jgi:hypothetical protein
MLRAHRILAPSLLCVLLLTACATSVGRVTADPSRYRNRDVTINGYVADSASVLGRGVYRVEDNTGSLWVVSTQGVPRQGARVTVKGRVQDGFDASMFGGLNLPAGLSSGVVLIESSHRIR